MRSPMLLILAIVTASFGCETGTVPLEDGGLVVDAGPEPELRYCPLTAQALDAEGQRTQIPVRCAWDSFCSTGDSVYPCLADGRNGLLQSIELRLDVLQALTSSHAGWPRCTADDQCSSVYGPGFCLFEPGCEAPSGICVSGPQGSLGNRPADMAEYFRGDCEGGCDVYCGCDGVTYESLPTKPFRYPGPCR